MKPSILKSHLESLKGFKKYAAAFGLGALMTLSTAPIGASYILLLCVPGIIWLARACKTKRAAFLTGWAFGAGYFVFGLYWVSVALFVDIQEFWWVLPFSVVAGPVALALFYGVIPLAAWRYRKNETAHALMLVAGWAGIEWVRGHVFTGFPWNLPGQTWHYLLPVMQVNAAVGIYGLTLLTLLWAAMPALPRKFVPVIMASFVLVGAAGMVRLYLNPTEQSGDYTVRIVQPNILQSFKWDAKERWKNFEHHLELTALPTTLKQPITFVVWPETAIMTDATQFTEISSHIAMNLPHGSTALLGALVVAQGGDKFFNSVMAIDKQANIIDFYKKHHLVPFGEYIPFRQYLNMTPIANGIAMIGDFTRGDGVTTLRIGNLPKPSPLICYEAIFPGAVASRADRPDWLLNVTNDAWYGKTAGPHQHFENVRIRAIEEGLPLVRSANTGISATIDPLGRIIGLKPLGETGVVDTILPKLLPPTLYARFGDALFFLMLALLAIFGETVRLKH
jgi:apolipoprotein N-acyltransferase